MKDEILSATENARRRLQFEAGQYCLGEPLTIIQYLLFRSFIQEAHLYALLDQLSTGKLETLEMQKRFADHMQRIAEELRLRRSSGGIVLPTKEN